MRTGRPPEGDNRIWILTAADDSVRTNLLPGDTSASTLNGKAHNLSRVAVHEAGHAVASYHLATPLRYVTIKRDKSGWTRGHTRQRWVWFHDKQGVFDDSPRGRDRVERHILVSLAGQIALRRYAPRSRWRSGSAGDTRQAMDLFWHICDQDKKAARLYMALLWRRAEWLIETNWKDVLAVARALTERRMLKAQEVAKLILARRSGRTRKRRR